MSNARDPLPPTFQSPRLVQPRRAVGRTGGAGRCTDRCRCCCWRGRGLRPASCRPCLPCVRAVRHSGRPDGRPFVAPLADDECRDAARAGFARNPCGASDQHAQLATARPAGLPRGLRHVVYSVATPSLVPSLVAPSSLPAANARIELARTVAFASGPRVGRPAGRLDRRRPGVRLRRRPVHRRGRPRGESRSSRCVRQSCGAIRGRRSRKVRLFVFHHDLLRPVFVTQFIFNTASFVILAVFVPYAVRRLGCRRQVSARRCRCTASAWWWAHSWPTRVMRWLPFGTVIGLGPVTGFVASAVIALTTVFPTRSWPGWASSCGRGPDPMGDQHRPRCASR